MPTYSYSEHKYNKVYVKQRNGSNDGWYGTSCGYWLTTHLYLKSIDADNHTATVESKHYILGQSAKTDDTYTWNLSGSGRWGGSTINYTCSLTHNSTQYSVYGSTITKGGGYNSSGTNERGSREQTFSYSYDSTTKTYSLSCYSTTAVSPYKNTYYSYVPQAGSVSTDTYELPKIYTIEYDLNGGTSAAISDQYKVEAQDITLYSGTPTKTNNIFLGWGLSKDQTTADYTSGQTYSTEGSVVLYAIWKTEVPTIAGPETITDISEKSFKISGLTSDINCKWYYKIGSGAEQIITETGTMTMPDVSLSGLVANTSYTITIIAKNSTKSAAEIESFKCTYAITYKTKNYPSFTLLFSNNTSDSLSMGDSATVSYIDNYFYKSFTVSGTLGGQTISLGAITGIVGNVTGSTVFNNLKQQNWINTITTSKSGTLTITVTGTAQDGTTITKTFSGITYNLSDDECKILIDSNIAVNDFVTVSDGTAGTGAATDISLRTGSANILFQGYSKLKYILNSNKNCFKTNTYGLSSLTYSVTVNSKTTSTVSLGTNYYEGSSASAVSSVSDACVITAKTNYELIITAIDGRGYSASVTRTFATSTYQAPTINAFAKRKDGTGKTVYLTTSGTWGNQWNGAYLPQKLSYRYKTDSASSTWSSYYTLRSNPTDVSQTHTYFSLTISDTDSERILSVEFYDSNAYIIEVLAEDVYGSNSTTCSIPLGNPIMFIDAEQNGVGINCYPLGDGLWLPKPGTETGERIKVGTSGAESDPMFEAWKAGDSEGNIEFGSNVSTVTAPTFVGALSGNAATATKATQDANGNVIADTYQTKLTNQTAYSAKGTATMVPQITTNTLGQVTKIEEVTITQPSAGTTVSAVSTTASAGSATTWSKSDHVHNITSSTVTGALGYTPYNSTNPAGYTTNTGTIEGVSVNGTSIATSGVANITSIPSAIIATGALANGMTATTQSQGDNSTKLATTAYVDTAIDNLPEPMVFKGSLGTGGTITTLPTASSSNEGWTYKVITAGTYASQTAKIGDTFICAKGGTESSPTYSWVLIPSGDEPSGTVTSITLKATSPIAIDSTSAITSSGTRTLSHATSGVTAGTYKSVTVNATGHVTGGSNPTTLSGYGITDAKIDSGKITLGSNSITPLTASSTLDATKLSGTASISTTGNAATATSATSATKDSKSQDIADTYIKGLSVNGRVITYTKGDGDTGTITTQDTTYSTATASANGLMSSTDKSKLDGIASGAEVNVNADWSATSGDAQILNKPTTISGYGITDAKIASGVITLGSNSLTVQNNLTSTSTTDPLSANQGKVLNDSKMGAVSANGYYGMAKPDGTASDWIRTTTSGIIPYQSGSIGSGHGGLGTSSWYFSTAYVDNVHSNKTYITENSYMQYNSTDKCIEFKFN